MNPELYTYAKNGNKSKFISLYQTLTGANNDEAAAAFNAFRNQINGKGKTSDFFGGGSTSSSNDTTGTGLLSMINDGFKSVGKIANNLLETQYGKEERQNSAGMVTQAIAEGGINPLQIFSSLARQSGEAVIGQLKAESELLSEVNSKVGISGELSEGLRKDMIAASVEASRYGITLSEIGNFYTQMSNESGKMALINRQLMEDAMPVATVLDKTLADMASTVAEFEKVGLGADKTIQQLDKTATNTIGLGLNARKIADSIQKNIGLLNQYGFENGYKGLERMAQKAAEFRMEMASVTTIADKVFSPEGAIDLAANLQVLGGAIGEFNDPLKLMYDATNNVEGLQDALIGAASGLATYNQEQGRFEITGVNLRKAKEMANALGITMGELNKTAIAAAERSSAAAALMGRSFDIKDEEKEFLINMSRMEGGEMKIVVPESLQEKLGNVQEIALDQITEQQKNILTEYQKEFQRMDSKSIAMSQLTETQKLVRGMDVLASYVRVRLTAMGKGALEGVAKQNMEDATKALTMYAGTLDMKKIESQQSDTASKVKGFIEHPIDTMTSYFKEKWDNYMNSQKTQTNQTTNTAPTQTTQNINMTVTHKSEGPITDSWNREMMRDSSIVSNWASRASDLTTPNVAHRK